MADLTLDARLELLNNAQEQLYCKRMPPEEVDQPSAADRELVTGWLSVELKRFGASKLDDKLPTPEYGNYVDHHNLFSGEYAALRGFTYASARERSWPI